MLPAAIKARLIVGVTWTPRIGQIGMVKSTLETYRRKRRIPSSTGETLIRWFLVYESGSTIPVHTGSLYFASHTPAGAARASRVERSPRTGKPRMDQIPKSRNPRRSNRKFDAKHEILIPPWIGAVSPRTQNLTPGIDFRIDS